MATKILIAEDEPFNIEFLTRCLEGAGFEVVVAHDGAMALDRLRERADVDAILLDRMMPRMDGMEVLCWLKGEERYKDIPVIMQTAASSVEEVMEGIQAGVHYYLSKPYEHSMLLCVVRAALEDARSRNAMREEVSRHQHALGLIERAQFHFRTLEEAKHLAYHVAACFPDPATAVWGLSELMVNAIEHGNLGITYEEKTHLLMADRWQHEIDERQALEKNRRKYAGLLLDANTFRVRVRITDQGKGFNWKRYLDISPERAAAPHGRGIAIARITSFSSLRYLGCGNQVECTQAIQMRHTGKATETARQIAS